MDSAPERRVMSIRAHFEAAADAVLISQIAAQPTALHLCGVFKQHGMNATLSLLPGIAGYQVFVHRVSLEDAMNALQSAGIELVSD